MHLRDLFTGFPPSVPKYGKKEKKELCNEAVRKTSTGNILVQFGRYVTEEDIATAKRKAFLSIR
jgi:hypothetical protein